MSIQTELAKGQLIAQMPELEAHRNGRDVILAFRKDRGPVLSQASEYNPF